MASVTVDGKVWEPAPVDQGDELSFEQVAQFAYPDKEGHFEVHYEDALGPGGHPIAGNLGPGESIKVFPSGTKFSVTPVVIKYNILVDTEPVPWPKSTISYLEVTQIAYKDWTELSLFTVDYANSAEDPADGKLQSGGTARLKLEGTSFDVSYLGES